MRTGTATGSAAGTDLSDVEGAEDEADPEVSPGVTELSEVMNRCFRRR